jgi:hypothetical protein
MRLELVTNPTGWHNGSSTLPNYIILLANLDVWTPMAGFIFREFVIMDIFHTPYKAKTLNCVAEICSKHRFYVYDYNKQV